MCSTAMARRNSAAAHNDLLLLLPRFRNDFKRRRAPSSTNDFIARGMFTTSEICFRCRWANHFPYPELARTNASASWLSFSTTHLLHFALKLAQFFLDLEQLRLPRRLFAIIGQRQASGHRLQHAQYPCDEQISRELHGRYRTEGFIKMDRAMYARVAKPFHFVSRVQNECTEEVRTQAREPTRGPCPATTAHRLWLRRLAW